MPFQSTGSDFSLPSSLSVCPLSCVTYVLIYLKLRVFLCFHRCRIVSRFFQLHDFHKVPPFNTIWGSPTSGFHPFIDYLLLHAFKRNFQTNYFLLSIHCIDFSYFLLYHRPQVKGYLPPVIMMIIGHRIYTFNSFGCSLTSIYLLAGVLGTIAFIT